MRKPNIAGTGARAGGSRLLERRRMWEPVFLSTRVAADRRRPAGRRGPGFPAVSGGGRADGQAMTTGVLTFHRCFNYGSYWQARCLVEGLRARGHDAVLLDHYSRAAGRQELKCGFQPVLPTPVPPADRLLYGMKLLRFSRDFARLPLSRRFRLEDPAEMESYDQVVVGSDEVWNLYHPWYGRCPLFYGEGIRAGWLASYAASFGNYPAAYGLEQAWVDRLRAFHTLSVRDENSRVLVTGATGREPELVLDPCLQFPLRPEGRWRGPAGPFALVYGHNFSEHFADRARRWARTRGLPLLSVGYRNAWAGRHWIPAGPHDFAHAMSRAAAVVTNFFHGCVFALRSARPFACELTPYRSVKVDNLMAAVGGEAHLIHGETSDADFQARLNEAVHPGILQRIVELREQSEQFLAGLGPSPASAPAGLRVATA